MSQFDELKRLAEAVRDSDIDWEPNQKSYDYFQALRDPRVVLALIAENERLESEAVYSAAGFDAAREEISKLRAEVAGLRTGYEACERVNAELKAENEALRKDAERWRFFSVLANDLQAFPHAWGKMTPEKMDAMCDQAMADAAMSQGEQS